MGVQEDAYEKALKEVEEYYDDKEKLEREFERRTRFDELYALEAEFQNAATKEGKKKLKEIQDEIKELEKEEEKEKTEEEKQAKIDAINKKWEDFENSQNELLNNVVDNAYMAANTLEDINNMIGNIVSDFTSSINDILSGQTGTSKNVKKYYNFNQNNNIVNKDAVSASIFGKYISNSGRFFMGGI